MIAAGVTSVLKGQTPTHLAFLIGYMDGSQIVLPIYGCNNMWCIGVKGTRNERRVREAKRKERKRDSDDTEGRKG